MPASIENVGPPPFELVETVYKSKARIPEELVSDLFQHFASRRADALLQIGHAQKRKTEIYHQGRYEAFDEVMDLLKSIRFERGT